MAKEVFKCAHSDVLKVSNLLLMQNPKNNNKHPKDQIERLAKIIDFQGQRSPIVISKRSGFIVKGHGRLFALDKLGWENAAVDYQEYKTEAEEYADMTADNEIARWAELDEEKFLSDLKGLDLGDIDLLGLKDFTLDISEPMVPLTDEDAAPENVETRCKPGDIWTLGAHRLMCGDSKNIAEFEKLMNGEKADMVFTSPPYGVGLDYNSYDDSFENTRSVVQSVLLTMSKITDGYIALNWGDIVSGREINKTEFPSQFSWMPLYNETLNQLGFWLWAQRIWKKPHARVSAPWSASSNRNVTDWEYLFTWSNGKQQSNLRQADSHFGIIDSSDSGQTDTLKDHPGAFPTVVAEKMVNIHTSAGFSVVDPFGGTGTTLIACEKTNRKCFMMELDPHYCDVIIKRWEQYTGKKAELTNGPT